MTDHLDEMCAKIELLRSRGAVEELERRLEEEGEFDEMYVVSPLELPAGIAVADHLPAGLRTLLALTQAPQFGDLVFHGHTGFHSEPLIDHNGEILDVGNTLTIGRVEDQGKSIVIDVDTEAVFIFDFLYFRHALDSGFVLRCESVAEFINTVALGSRYWDIHGPHEIQSEAWWLIDPWYIYLRELGLV
ncbi:MAG: hypothetical protein JWN03_5698 [Nocardia sp.]|nr:hypothetical protein [Nocardia sp.]